ncbi:lycopene beta-cyclase [Fodinibius salinus]|uniref:Lycopene beta-cyclase n=1 Tax=Fodinibius salinus TaxID=860790 RepID=A0A5D3YNX5_9BACT|nr:lycopene cyclase family protein [Fodinibius salinus]TYP95507.1 lycopene beta-cyclase [Fodinibius salinus]
MSKATLDQQYDYIIAGAGAAGLSLAWKMIHSPLSDKKTLVIDNELEPTNTKTWCFWESGAPPFSDIIHKKWTHTKIGTSQKHFSQPLNEYPYYCIRKIDFQRKIHQAIRSHPHFTLAEEQITTLESHSDSAILHTNDHSYQAEYIFQSCFPLHPQKKQAPKHPLWQHFLGWEITVEEPLFDPQVFTLMDFDDSFCDGIAFMYILPWSATSALIEYTIFSERVEEQSFYEDKISLYLNNQFNLRPIDYQINRQELGKIPMQDLLAKPWYKPRILNIGTSSGRTKPSTGYTFQRIQQQTKNLVTNLNKTGTPDPQPPSAFRYKAYDLWLLHIIHTSPQKALTVFKQLFTNNSADDLFRFLGEQSTFRQDLSIMSSVPYAPFLKAIWNTRNRLWQIFKNYLLRN